MRRHERGADPGHDFIRTIEIKNKEGQVVERKEVVSAKGLVRVFCDVRPTDTAPARRSSRASCRSESGTTTSETRPSQTRSSTASCTTLTASTSRDRAAGRPRRRPRRAEPPNDQRRYAPTPRSRCDDRRDHDRAIRATTFDGMRTTPTSW